MSTRQAIDALLLRKLSEGTHLCAYCDAFDGDMWRDGGTTGDCHSCSLFAAWQDGYVGTNIRDGCGNTREYTDGTKTVDNGGGFYVVACPRFERMDDSAIYGEYMRGDEWKQKRRARIELDGYRCKMCGSPINLNVHHITYDRLGYEEMDDLVTLCKICHAKLHGKEEET